MPELPAEWTAAFRPFADALPTGPVAVLCHSDGDGLAAGAILVHALRRAGRTVAVEVTAKGGGAWTDDSRERLARHSPVGLFVTDLGCRPEPVLPGVPTCFVDHHKPDPPPDGGVLVTGYGREPIPTSGLLAYDCGATLADVSDLDWLAALSLLSDLGDKAPFPLLAAAKKRHGATRLRDAVSLVNASRRSATGDGTPALELLLACDGPRQVLDGTRPQTAQLLAAEEEVAGELARCKKVGPQIVGDVAVVLMHSACQVHPLVAQVWRTRLPVGVVIAANSGYLPGRVNFSARTSRGVNLLDFFARHRPEGAGDSYGRGHDQASGGSLEYGVWDKWVTDLGFGPKALAPRGVSA